MKKELSQDKKGFTVLEPILALALLGIFVLLAIPALFAGQEGSLSGSTREEALILADEGLEAARSIKDSGFANLTDGVHGLGTSTGWSLQVDTMTIEEIYTRTLTISTIDERTKKVVSSVSWVLGNGSSEEVSLATYLTNWR